LTLWGCAFHQIEQPLAGSTYAIVPVESQEGSLEFKTYAAMLKDELFAKGLTEAPIQQANFAIFMHYGIGEGKQVVTNYPIYGQTGVSRSTTTGTVNTYGNSATYNQSTYNTPSYGVVGTGTATSTVFQRYLFVNILDVNKYKAGVDAKIYEGTAKSDGTSDQLSAVLPIMMKSLLVDFPGKSGSSKIVTKQLPK